MAAIASASPIPIHSYSLETRRHTSRAALRSAASRAQMRPSPRANDFRQSYTRPSDSSDDDEDLAPIKLSAEAQAILGEENSQAQSDKENVEPQSHGARSSYYEDLHSHERWSPPQRDGSPAPRVVRMPAPTRPTPPTVLERDGSFAYKVHDKSRSYGTLERNSRTPAQHLRKVRVSGSRSQTKSPRSAEAADEKPQDPEVEDDRSPHEEERGNSPEQQEDNHGPYTISRPRRTKETAGHSTIRASRIGRGKFLKGPVRRGVIRRQSDDAEANDSYQESAEYSPEVQQGRRAEVELDNKPDDLLIDYESPQPRRRASPPNVDNDGMMQRSQSPVVQQHERPLSPPRPIAFSASIGRQHPTPALASGPGSSRSSSSKRPIFKIPSLPPLESAHEPENEPPPTFRRAKPAPAELQIHEDDEAESRKKPESPKETKESPSRQPLAARGNNTPHRPAPAPPPKMSLIEAATSNAGNSRAKKSVHYVLNGRTYRRLDCIGRGGSSRVFRIMAENYKIFALKRVNLEEADMAAIAGYKGEIELLKKLENVDRVIRLFDYEVNEEKGVLNVMMELGETDFNKMLNEQLKGDNSKLDITFTRHYWKEMLECVQAVHQHDIVHSDLKPANFLLVKGQLKLIDFGIANAIQDNTVNVHRENQIGTPNYMSPESLVCHAPIAGQAAGTKLLKLGKPSDVWSLGCILYQMTYGQPPFAHIQKQFERIMSIPNPKVEIQFPSTGIGGSVVPFGFIKTLKRCLQRDQTLRPTIKELLSDADPFLNPVAISPDMLGRVIGNVVSYCRKREESFRQAGQLGQEGISCLPRDEDMRGWPLAFYEKLKQAQEEGTAW
ncbi:hypothetical protein PMZ80_006734 [Knufia obscura]|uniref:Protein kinase domain-containing protein n=2 Tax=Knufia TaxID=430999 RepID=A0AAN8IHP8_9EURO|nr:hypothetical protein PMZ80_006734 [Knufia obscura]KAK5948277.1 hypothetical protein OHC33_010711 [Knufia fluminis]